MTQLYKHWKCNKCKQRIYVFGCGGAKKDFDFGMVCYSCYEKIQNERFTSMLSKPWSLWNTPQWQRHSNYMLAMRRMLGFIAEAHSKFWNCEFYDADRGQEILDHSEVYEALEDEVNNCWEATKTPEENVRALCPITLYGFKRKEVGDATKHVKGDGDYLLEQWEENLFEEWGDFDGDHNFWTKEERKEICLKLDAVLAEALSKIAVWQCEEHCSRIFEFEEVWEILKEDYVE